MIARNINFSLGSSERPKLPENWTVNRRCGSWVFGSPEAGKLINIASAAALMAAVPEVFIYHINYAIGDEVPRFTHSGTNMGYILFDCPDGKSYETIVGELEQALNLIVQSAEVVANN